MVEPATAVHAASAHAASAHASAADRQDAPARQRRHGSDHAAQGQSPLQRLQALADASPQVAQLQRLQALADGAVLGTRQCKTPEEEEPLQGRFRTVQRQSPEDEELLQGKFATTPATPAPNRTGLTMDHVRVHYNSEKPAQLNAHAYAQGSDIHLAPGQDRHLPHEAWHLVQQAQGRVQPTLQLNGGVAVNDDPSLEHEADQMGERALASGG